MNENKNYRWQRGILCRPMFVVQEILLPTEIKPIFAIKETECDFDSFGTQARQLQVSKFSFDSRFS